MPCYDPQRAEDETHNGIAAGLLCELCNKVKQFEIRHPILDSEFWTPELRKWWTEHQARDRAWNIISQFKRGRRK